MSDAINLANTYIKLVKQSGIPVNQAYLFGSYAKGKVWEGSDIDICIVSDAFGKDYWNKKRQLNKIALQLDSKIEPVVFSTKDFGNKYDTLASEVKRFGILLNLP